jgi:hypothetical protein
MFLFLMLASPANAQQNTRYFGYEIAAASPSYRIKSNVPEIAHMYVPFYGMRVGGILSNPQIKLKASAGLHYGSADLPRTFDLLSGNISAQVYPLRLKTVKYHTFEPYVVGGVSQYQTNFYGSYLSEDKPRNNSVSREKLIGRTYSTQLIGGIGVEYQLENDNNFIHFFSELSFGTAIHQGASTSSLSCTFMQSSWALLFGINFGIVKD